MTLQVLHPMQFESRPKKLLDQVRNAIHLKYYS